VWPGVAIVIVVLLLRFVLPVVYPDGMMIGLFAGFFGTGVVALWWLLLSRAAWVERLGAIVLMAAALFAVRSVVDISIATGAMGFLYFFLASQILGPAVVLWAVVTRNLSNGVRRATMVATIFAACGVCAMIRTGGFIASDFKNDLHWRWVATPEERLIAQAANEPLARPPAPPPAAETPAREKPAGEKAAKAPAPPAPKTAESPAEWPGFRGPHRDGIVTGVRIKTDWTASPPHKMWSRAIGPGWSSFAVHGDRLYTQEQRGPDEIVSCYKVSTGEPVWMHRDQARFYESNAGPGPRGTPTLDKGRVYALGATGILNALSEADGAVVWTRNAQADTGAKLPGWGFSGSPLVVGDLVIVATSGKLAAYDIATGAPRWMGPDGGDGYSSPQLFTIDGVEQVLLMSETGATSVSPADGSVLWKHAWKSATRIMQPAITAEGDLVITSGDAMGGGSVRRIAVVHGPGGWTTEERWTSAALKPNFNDSVIHNGYMYGFDGSILACIDLKDGKRAWKGGRYGDGQFLLLADQDVLVVVSEEGELALVGATPDKFTELARAPGVEGKTWGHPVVAGDVLLVRNGEEMAAFRLTPAER